MRCATVPASHGNVRTSSPIASLIDTSINRLYGYSNTELSVMHFPLESPNPDAVQSHSQPIVLPNLEMLPPSLPCTVQPTNAAIITF